MQADGSESYLREIVKSAWKWERKKSSIRPAVFLDRDGTINQDPGYLNDPNQLKLLHGVGDAIARLNRAGFWVVVVTNQSGVSRGLIKPEALPRIHARLDELLRPMGAHIDHYAICTHLPNAGCLCRKPGTGMILDATHRLGIDLSRSFMVGDRETDIEAGQRAFCGGGSVLVMTGAGSVAARESKTNPAHTADDLSAAVGWILNLTAK
ncbi:MAG: HAD family hydrolase [Bdellovibrionota bacterium]